VDTAKSLMFIGDSPSTRDRYAPYVGWAGKEFNQHLLPRFLGRGRQDVWFTNTAKCGEARNERDKQVPRELLLGCAAHWLPREFDTCDPYLIVLMGSAALKPWRMETGEEFVFELHHGFAYDARFLDEKRTRRVFIVTHPSSAAHNSESLRFVYEDFEALGREMARQGASEPPRDLYAGREDYSEITTERELDAYVGEETDVALDTETREDPDADDDKTPLFAQLSVREGTGRLIDYTNTRVLKRLHRLLRGRQVWMHNALFDLEILERMGVYVDRFTDTMEIAFTLQLERQSLKVLGYRLCGMHMQEYLEVVKPYADRDTLAWMRRALAHVHPGKLTKKAQAEYDARFEGRDKPTYFSKPPAQTRFDGSIYRPHGVGTKIKLAMTHHTKNPVDTDLRERVHGWSAHEQDEIESLIGRMPPFDLSRVPRWMAIHYACRDTDTTLRVGRKLVRMAARVSRQVRQGNEFDIEGEEYRWLYDTVSA
jgi:uracil-DNA glycosylase family 4